ncbi:hypothetical protein ACQJBY_047570 [Aegilops geniculata]
MDGRAAINTSIATPPNHHSESPHHNSSKNNNGNGHDVVAHPPPHRPRPRRRRRGRRDHHNRGEPVLLHDMAGRAPRRRRAPRPGPVVAAQHARRHRGRQGVAAHGVHLRRQRTRPLHHRRLRGRAVLPRVGRAARHAGGVHAGAGREPGLLRPVRHRRLQYAHELPARRRRAVPCGDLRRRHHQGVPAGAAGARWVRQRLRQVRRRHLLLPGPVRAQLPADQLLEVLQGQVPRRLQLRQGRPDQHLHMSRRNQLPDRPLPRPK